MEAITTNGLDIAKSVFQVHGIDAAGNVVVRRQLKPRLVMRPRMVRSPVDICLGTSPIHAEKSRPLANAAPLPIAATIALEMIGPMPGTVITLRQPSSLFAKVSISSVVEFRLAQLAVASVVPLPRR